MDDHFAVRCTHPLVATTEVWAYDEPHGDIGLSRHPRTMSMLDARYVADQIREAGPGSIALSWLPVNEWSATICLATFDPFHEPDPA